MPDGSSERRLTKKATKAKKNLTKAKKKLKNATKSGASNKTISKLNRQFLHAKILGFNHPKSGKKLFFESNLPKDLKKIINALEKPC